MKRPRVLLADDHKLVVEGILKLLENEPLTIDTVEDGGEVLGRAERLQPDVILLDISMPFLNGIEAARRLREIAPRSRIIFLTMHADPEHVREALRCGASGYLLKRSAASELVTALRQVMQGRTYIDPYVAGLVLDVLGRPSPVDEKSGKLTPRQREVLRLVAEGHSNGEIARILGISIRTVVFHKSAIMTTLSLHSTAELTQYAVRHGLIDNSASPAGV